MSDVRAKPIPFSAEPSFIDFLDEMARIMSTSRSGYLRQCAKELARQKFPQVYAKHFPDEAAPSQTVISPPQIMIDPTPPSPIRQTPTIVDEPDDFLEHVNPRGNRVHTSEENINYGAPDSCPNCGIQRFEYENGNVVKTNVQCSTNPSKGRWVCNECTASGEYFPDRPPTIV